MRVIELDKYRKRTAYYSINEKENYYSCIFTKKHRNKKRSLTGIKLGDVYTVITLGEENRYFLDAIHFFKDKFTLSQVIDWLDRYVVIFLNYTDGQSQFHIKNCRTIKDIVQINNRLLLMYEKGEDNLVLDKKELSNHLKSTNIASSVPMEITLVINEEQIDYIPKIKLNKKEDVLIVNGNCIVADYIDEYNGNLGFYLNSNPVLPISFIFTQETYVYIDIINRENGRVIIIEYEYEIQLL